LSREEEVLGALRPEVLVVDSVGRVALVGTQIQILGTINIQVPLEVERRQEEDLEEFQILGVVM